MDMAKHIFSVASKLPAVECKLPHKTIVLDLETTGLSSAFDEVLQVSIINEEGTVLLNSYVKPYYTEVWPDAERVNNISPEMVADAPYPHEILPIIKGIIEDTETIITYNGEFDMGFLRKWGITSHAMMVDVMEAFAPYYGEWSSRYQGFKWQSLSFCSTFFGYEFSAHDSLEDVKATLFCYNKLAELRQSGEYDARCDANWEYAYG